MRHFLTLLATVLIGVSGLAAQTTPWRVYTTATSDIPLDFVGPITVDRSGTAWMSCKGLTKFDGSVWENYSITTLDVSHDSKGNIWCASDLFGGSLTKFDGTTKTSYTSATSGLQSDWVTSVTVDSSDVVWAGCTFGGVSRFDGTKWTSYNAADMGLQSVGYIRVMRHSGTDLWVGQQTGGLLRFNGTAWTNYNPENSGLPNEYVSALAPEAGGKIWVGMMGGGVASFDGTTWKTFNMGNSGLPNDSVNALLVDGDGKLWVGTNDGLARFDGTEWLVHRASKSGLPSSRINALAADPQGGLWIGTAGGGLAVYTPSTASMRPAAPELTGLHAVASPNPARDMVMIGVESDRPARLRFSLMDNLGRCVAETSRDIGSGRMTVPFRTAGLASGFYHCIISDGTASRGVAIVIER